MTKTGTTMTSKKTWSVATASVLVLATLIAGPALAHGGKGGAGRGAPIDFEALDTNSDGALTREEVAARGEGMFSQADSNNNGVLSQEEIEAQGGKRAKRHAARMIERLDANNDGQLSLAEIQDGRSDRREARLDRMFERLDADQDDRITKAEFDARPKKKRGN
ncbi:EF-hand domain-containing protein [Primorskyibacter sp. S187A]|uniref:EF-hand domain-containing protein n=1 Tax=Primorskyibacter sp. S187A TaxID=3415130 RepID=UPI003C7A948D